MLGQLLSTLFAQLSAFNIALAYWGHLDYDLQVEHGAL
jgi:hypothetical protein